MSLSLTNRVDIVANSFSIMTEDGPVNIIDKIQEDVTGLPPETLNTLEELADAIGNHPTFFEDLEDQINLKAPKANPTFTGTVIGVTKTHVGLGNVDNTSDPNKAISLAT